MIHSTALSRHRERQREQVVRLLGESLTNSVTSVARDVVSKEAESICNSVNSMLKTLNGQLMQSVDEVQLIANYLRFCLLLIMNVDFSEFD
jgi:hypothetical protein